MSRTEWWKNQWVIVWVIVALSVGIGLRLWILYHLPVCGILFTFAVPGVLVDLTAISERKIAAFRKILLPLAVVFALLLVLTHPRFLGSVIGL